MENKEFKELSDSEYLAQFNFATQEDYRKAEDFLKRFKNLDPKDCPSIRIPPAPKDFEPRCVSVWTDPSFDKYRKEELKITYMPWNNL